MTTALTSQLQRARDIAAEVYEATARDTVPASHTAFEWEVHVAAYCVFTRDGSYDDQREVKIALAAIQSIEGVIDEPLPVGEAA